MGKVHVKTALAFFSSYCYFQIVVRIFNREAPLTAAKDDLELIMTSTGYNWVAMRYNKVTGEAWFQFPYYWQTIGEDESDKMQ